MTCSYALLLTFISTMMCRQYRSILHKKSWQKKEKMWRELRIDTLCFEALGVFLPTPRKTCSQGLSHCWFLLPIYCWRLFLITNYYVVQHGSLSLSAELSSAHWVSNEIPAYCHICSCIIMLKEHSETKYIALQWLLEVGGRLWDIACVGSDKEKLPLDVSKLVDEEEEKDRVISFDFHSS